MTDQKRKLPVSLQSFVKIRKEHFLYVDKTDLVWQLVNSNFQYNYLSRPRRFGKSILVDTLECYLSGKKELFEGLKIMSLEKKWAEHPVIRLDMSQGGDNAGDLKSYLNKAFSNYEQKYNIQVEEEDSLANRFDAIIKVAHQQTGNAVAILIDEYDSPLLHSWGTQHHEECAAIYRNVFATIKSDDAYECFVFITGVTKFTQISLFSALNNLNNISFDPQYAALCGITDAEIDEYFQPEIQNLADNNGWTPQEAHLKLKEYYDGYHFSRQNMVDIYNPYSLILALAKANLTNYWAASGATTLLSKFIDNAEIRMSGFSGCRIARHILETSDVAYGSAELFLYQAGYLTIKSCDEFGYILEFPNTEVRQSLFEVVLPTLALRTFDEVQSIQANLVYQLGTAQLDEAKESLRSLIADVPYSNKKLASMDMEERYRLIISTILNALGLRVEVERMHSRGRIDIVAWTSRYIYVIELKLSNNGGKKSAANQIRTNGYLEPFRSDSRQTIGLAIELDNQGKGLIDWEVLE